MYVIVVRIYFENQNNLGTKVGHVFSIGFYESTDQ